MFNRIKPNQTKHRLIGTQNKYRSQKPITKLLCSLNLVKSKENCKNRRRERERVILIQSHELSVHGVIFLMLHQPRILKSNAVSWRIISHVICVLNDIPITWCIIIYPKHIKTSLVHGMTDSYVFMAYFFGMSGRFLKIKLAINCMQQQITDKLGAKTRAAYSKHQRKMKQGPMLLFFMGSA